MNEPMTWTLNTRLDIESDINAAELISIFAPPGSKPYTGGKREIYIRSPRKIEKGEISWITDEDGTVLQLSFRAPINIEADDIIGLNTANSAVFAVFRGDDLLYFNMEHKPSERQTQPDAAREQRPL